MKMMPRILMTLAAACVLTLFFFPMWRITLYAPQYPDGVSMYIWINKITGDTPGALQNINILNHYVGMKYIEPDAIPELKYFPYVIVGLALLALVAVVVDKSWAYLAWVLLFVVLAALGLYDFYLWEYDYGHNLSPMAPIKIPGASFQPPLLGSKRILNFIAQSYPHNGGYLAGLGALLATIAWRLKIRQHEKRNPAGVDGARFGVFA
jgi:copper chaperone NosL